MRRLRVFDRIAQYREKPGLSAKVLKHIAASDYTLQPRTSSQVRHRADCVTQSCVDTQ